MPHLVALAAALVVAIDGSPDGTIQVADPVATPQAVRPLLAAPEGSALTLTPRIGIAVCGYCGLLLGGAATVRSGPWISGVFVEGATVPVMDRFTAPGTTQDSPSVEKATSAFVGGLIGSVRDLRRFGRLGLTVEGGAQGVRAIASWRPTESAATSERSLWGWFPLVGARASVAWRTRDDTPVFVGLAAFARVPLWTPCMNVGNGCERPTMTGGVAVEMSIDLRRRGTESFATPATGS
jgi:hypothetical protein